MGGGCEWQPFEITSVEYRELVAALLADLEAGFFTDEDFADLSSHIEWLIAVLSKYYQDSNQVVATVRQSLAPELQ